MSHLPIGRIATDLSTSRYANDDFGHFTQLSVEYNLCASRLRACLKLVSIWLLLVVRHVCALTVYLGATAAARILGFRLYSDHALRQQLPDLPPTCRAPRHTVRVAIL